MATLYTRTYALKDALTDEDVLAYWRFAMEEVAPACLHVPGIRSVKFYSGAGALRADLSILIEMDDAAAYERLLLDPRAAQTAGSALRLLGSQDGRTVVSPRDHTGADPGAEQQQVDARAPAAVTVRALPGREHGRSPAASRLVTARLPP
jgi:hypothetical protein